MLAPVICLNSYMSAHTAPAHTLVRGCIDLVDDSLLFQHRQLVVELLQIALGDETFNIALSYEKLTVLSQVDCAARQIDEHIELL